MKKHVGSALLLVAILTLSLIAVPATSKTGDYQVSTGFPDTYIQGRVSEDGLTYAVGVVVIARDAVNGNYTTYCPTYRPWNPVAEEYYDYGSGTPVNYFIYSDSDGNTVYLYSTNGTNFGYNSTIYPSSGFTDADINISSPIPADAPHDAEIHNDAPIGTNAIRLNWTHSVDADRYLIFRTANETSGGYSDHGKEYGSTPIATLSRSAVGYLDSSAANGVKYYYFIESQNDTTGGYNYSEELNMTADFTAPEVSHTNVTEYTGISVPIEANFTDNVEVTSGTIYFRKQGESVYETASMALSGGNTSIGNWTGNITVDSPLASVVYEYYIDVTDGFQNTTWATPTSPVELTVTIPSESRYPIMTFTKSAPKATYIGGNATYEIFYENIGDASAYNCTMLENYSSLGSYHNSSIAPDVSDDQWNLGRIKPGESGTLYINFSTNNDIPHGTVMNNSASMDYDDGAGTSWTNWSNTSTYVVSSYTFVTKSGPSNAYKNTTIRYTIECHNYEPFGIVAHVNETYPGDVTYNHLGTSPIPTLGNNYWYVSWIGPNSVSTIFVTVDVNSDASGILGNSVEVQSRKWSDGTLLSTTEAWLNTTVLADPPSPISNVTAELADDAKNVSITWESIGINTDHYEIYRSETFDKDKTGYSMIGTALSTERRYLDVDKGDGNTSNLFYYVRAVNATGYQVNSTYQAAKLATYLTAGWNLNATPLIQNNTWLNTVLQTVQWNYTMVYNTTDASNHWRGNMTARPDVLDEVTHIEPYMGLWICNQGASGYMQTAGAVADTNISLYTGWNLVSFPYMKSKTVNQVISDIGGTCDKVKLFDDAHEYKISMATGTETLNVGNAMWVHVTADTIWTVNNY